MVIKDILCLFGIATINFAQVAGISGTKLLTPNAKTLEQGSFDFEPSFSVIRAARYFDGNGDTEKLGSNIKTSEVSFRITLGLFNNFELGTSFPSVLKEVYLGTKFNFFNNGTSAFALSVGGTLPTDSSNHKYSYGFGFIASHFITESFSFDGLISYSKINGAQEYDHIINYGLSFGYFIVNAVQLITELNGFSTYRESFHSKKISIIPGLTYLFSKNLLIVFGTQIDLWGNNELSGTNYFTAFTMNF